MKNFDRILEFLRVKGYPAFSTSEYWDIPKDIRRQVGAVLGSMTFDELTLLATVLNQDPDVPRYLIEEVRWYLSCTPEAQARLHHESIRQLINWYTDKQSKRVSYAAKQLKERFPSQSPAVQKTILKTFLHGKKKEAEWAGRYLRKLWIPAFESDVIEKWRETRIPVLASVILRHFPDNFILQEQEDLAQDLGYATICVRIGNLEGFTIDESRLAGADWFYVMGKLEREDAVSKMDGRLRECILALEPLDIPRRSESEVFDIKALGLSIWSMRKLHYTEGILRLLGMWEHADRYAMGEDDDLRHYALLFSMQRQADNLDEDKEAYEKAKSDWEKKYGFNFDVLEDSSLNNIDSFIDLC